MVLNDTLDQTDLIVIYRTFHPKATEYPFFLKSNGTFSRIDHTLGHKTNLNKFKMEVISIFSNHSGMKLEIGYKKKTEKMYRHVEAYDMLLSN